MTDTKITVSRAFCGRRVITVGKDDRSYFAKEVSGGWDVYGPEGKFAFATKVRVIELAVYNNFKSYE